LTIIRTPGLFSFVWTVYIYGGWKWAHNYFINSINDLNQYDSFSLIKKSTQKCRRATEWQTT